MKDRNTGAIGRRKNAAKTRRLFVGFPDTHDDFPLAEQTEIGQQIAKAMQAAFLPQVERGERWTRPPRKPWADDVEPVLCLMPVGATDEELQAIWDAINKGQAKYARRYGSRLPKRDQAPTSGHP